MVDASRGAPEVQSACVFPEIGGSRPRDFALSDWVDKRLLAVTHSGLGSLFEIGHWVPLTHPVSNDALPQRLRRYQGSEGLFVHCS